MCLSRAFLRVPIKRALPWVPQPTLWHPCWPGLLGPQLSMPLHLLLVPSCLSPPTAQPQLPALEQGSFSVAFRLTPRALDGICPHGSIPRRW